MFKKLQDIYFKCLKNVARKNKTERNRKRRIKTKQIHSQFTNPEKEMEERRLPGKGFRERKEKRLGFKTALTGKRILIIYRDVFFKKSFSKRKRKIFGLFQVLLLWFVAISNKC